MNCACDCHELNYDETLGTALNEAVEELTGAGASLSVLRNGGWEQWLRNTLLIKLEAPQCWGLTEARFVNIQRIDLAVYCTICNHPRFAIELKINFTKQSPGEVQDRLSTAICQLGDFAEHGVPTYIVYALTHLSGEAISPVVERQNVDVIPSYKYFHIPTGPWPNRGYVLPHEHYRASSYAHGDHCRAEVRAWLAKVQLANQPPDSRELLFITHGDQLNQHWIQNPGNPNPPNKKKWIVQAPVP